MKICTDVDLTDWIEEKRSELKEYDEIFDEIICKVESFYKKNPKYLTDYDETPAMDKIWDKMFDEREVYLKKVKMQTIDSIIDIIKED